MMSHGIVINVDLKCEVIGLSTNQGKQIQKEFEVRDPSAFYSRAYKMKQWDGYIRFVKFRENKKLGNILTFPIGYLQSVRLWFRRMKLDVELNGFQYFKMKGADFSLFDPDKFLREYQKTAVISMCKNVIGVIENPTGSGKTEVIGEYIRINLSAKVLYICAKKQVVLQTRKRLKNYLGEKPSILVGTHKRMLDSQVLVATPLSLENWLKKHPEHPLNFWDIIVADECHLAKATGFRRLISKLRWKRLFGFTASFPTIDVEPVIHTKIKSVVGSVIAKISDQEYRKKYEHVPDMIAIKVLNTLNIGAKKGAAVYEALKRDYGRNRLIASIAESLGRGVFILVNHIEHGKLIMNAMRRKDNVRFINAKDTSDYTMRTTFEEFNAGVFNILIATAVLDAGVSINNIFNTLNAAGYKSEIQLIQRTGRGTRTKEVGPNRNCIWDFMDFGHKTTESHARKRFKLYEDRLVDKIEVASIALLEDFIEKYAVRDV